MKNILTIIISVMVIDGLGFLLWEASGQLPTDNFYLGTLTANIIELLR